MGYVLGCFMFLKREIVHWWEWSVWSDRPFWFPQGYRTCTLKKLAELVTLIQMMREREKPSRLERQHSPSASMWTFQLCHFPFSKGEYKAKINFFQMKGDHEQELCNK